MADDDDRDLREIVLELRSVLYWVAFVLTVVAVLLAVIVLGGVTLPVEIEAG